MKKVNISKLNEEITIPPSKSYTHRAIILSCLANGTSCVYNALDSDDTQITINAMKQIGFHIRQESLNPLNLKISGGLQSLEKQQKPIKINFNESGTSARLITAICSILPNEIELTASQSLKNRPINELIDALSRIGAKIKYKDSQNQFPIIIKGNPIPKISEISISGEVSSQFISALLLIATLFENGLCINIKGNIISKPYINITIQLMKRFGVIVEEIDNSLIVKKQSYRPTSIYCEGDYTSASYFLGAIAILGGSLSLSGLNQNSVQGDNIIIKLLEKMGCNFVWSEDILTIHSKGILKFIDFDMSFYPDLVPIMAVVCSFAEGVSILRNIKHIQHKESNRIIAITENLAKVGIRNKYEDDNLYIYGNKNLLNDKDILINTFNDHRIAMSFAIIGLKIGSIIIDNPSCVSKSFPQFWKLLNY